jgi:predicted enzyme related to lactoylglutathione lyase
MAERPDAADIARWHRYFAVECNNRAWALADAAERTDAQVEELVHAAHAAALHWSQVGTELNSARAELLLAHALALAGDGTPALRYARRSFDYLTTRSSPDWEVAFAHMVLANAAHAAGDRALHARHHTEAARLGAAIAAPEDRQIFETSFRSVSAPDGAAPYFSRISTVRVCVRDQAAGVAFYRDVLRLELRLDTPAFALFEVGGVTLIVEPADAGDTNDGELIGRFLGVTLATNDLAATYSALRAQGVEFLHAPALQAWGGIMTHFKDPAGNVLTAVQFAAVPATR